MNFCFSVCEYDPLHLGHCYHLSQMKNSGADAVIVVMSGNFTQRGEIAIMDKFTRARHAVLSGADVVIELPTVFATAPAEIFASGAIKIIDALGGGKLMFGVESGNATEFLDLAKATSSESKLFKDALKKQLATGAPYAQARLEALKQTSSSVNLKLLETPNNILGVEYARAVLSQNASVEILPIKRLGSAFKDKKLGEEFSSATAIRCAIGGLNRKKAKKHVPSFVYDDLPECLPDASHEVLFSLLKTPLDEIKQVVDCTEGLENRIKVLARASHSFTELIDKLETKRYTRARLSRIVTSVMLGINKSIIEKCLKSSLYVKVLAVNKQKLDLLGELSNRLSGGKTTLITRKSDVSNLKGVAKDCFNIDVYANDVYNLVNKQKTNEYDMKLV